MGKKKKKKEKGHRFLGFPLIPNKPAQMQTRNSITNTNSDKQTRFFEGIWKKKGKKKKKKSAFSFLFLHVTKSKRV